MKKILASLILISLVACSNEITMAQAKEIALSYNMDKLSTENQVVKEVDQNNQYYFEIEDNHYQYEVIVDKKGNVTQFVQNDISSKQNQIIDDTNGLNEVVIDESIQDNLSPTLQQNCVFMEDVEALVNQDILDMLHLNMDTVCYLNSYQDKDDGITKDIVEFRYDHGFYEIEMIDGTFVEFDCDYGNRYQPSGDITREEALDIACDYLDTTNDQVEVLEYELDYNTHEFKIKMNGQRISVDIYADGSLAHLEIGD